MVVYRRLTGGRGHPFDAKDLTRAALALAGLLALALLLPRVRTFPTISGEAYVIDGDSIRLNGEELRLKGIDAPELHQSCERNGQYYPCGRDARAALIAKLRRGRLACQITGTDRYGRGLALCKVDDLDLNAALVREGIAVSYGGYEGEEREAKAERLGIWAGSFERPADWRRRHPRPK